MANMGGWPLGPFRASLSREMPCNPAGFECWLLKCRQKMGYTFEMRQFQFIPVREMMGKWWDAFKFWGYHGVSHFQTQLVPNSFRIAAPTTAAMLRQRSAEKSSSHGGDQPVVWFELSRLLMIPLGAKTRLRKPPEGRSTSRFLSITLWQAICWDRLHIRVCFVRYTDNNTTRTHRDTYTHNIVHIHSIHHFTIHTIHICNTFQKHLWSRHLRAMLSWTWSWRMEYSTVCRRRGTGRNSLDRKMAFGMPRNGKTSCFETVKFCAFRLAIFHRHFSGWESHDGVRPGRLWSIDDHGPQHLWSLCTSEMLAF